MTNIINLTTRQTSSISHRNPRPLIRICILSANNSILVLKSILCSTTAPKITYLIDDRLGCDGIISSRCGRCWRWQSCRPRCWLCCRRCRRSCHIWRPLRCRRQTTTGIKDCRRMCRRRMVRWMRWNRRWPDQIRHTRVYLLDNWRRFDFVLFGVCLLDSDIGSSRRRRDRISAANSMRLSTVVGVEWTCIVISQHPCVPHVEHRIS